MWNLLYSNEGTCLKFVLNTATARNPRLCSPRSTPLTALCHPSQTQSQPHLPSILLPLPPLQGHSILPSANPAALSHSFRSTQLTPRMFHGCPGNGGCCAVSPLGAQDNKPKLGFPGSPSPRTDHISPSLLHKPPPPPPRRWRSCTDFQRTTPPPTTHTHTLASHPEGFGCPLLTCLVTQLVYHFWPLSMSVEMTHLPRWPLRL